MFSRGNEGPMDVDLSSPKKPSPFWGNSASISSFCPDETRNFAAKLQKSSVANPDLHDVESSPDPSAFMHHHSNEVSAEKNTTKSSESYLKNGNMYRKSQHSDLQPLRSSSQFSFSDSRPVKRLLIENNAADFVRSSKLDSAATKKSHTQKPLFSFGKAAKKQGFSLADSNHFYYPYILMGYLQLVFNGFLTFAVVYVVVQFFLTVKRDVDIKVDKQMNEILAEIALCSKQYIENKCHPSTRVPAMEQACLAWETCMNRDPAVVGRAKVSAMTFAEIINSFVEPISYKTMLFFVVIVFGVFVVSNVAFGVARSRAWKFATNNVPQSAAVIPTTPQPFHALTPFQFITPANQQLFLSNGQNLVSHANSSSPFQHSFSSND